MGRVLAAMTAIGLAEGRLILLDVTGIQRSERVGRCWHVTVWATFIPPLAILTVHVATKTVDLRQASREAPVLADTKTLIRERPHLIVKYSWFKVSWSSTPSALAFLKKLLSCVRAAIASRK